MQDLLGRITALDPDASETLKVVSYFDALVARSVGVESMLRGAAVLSGTTAGYRDGSHRVRVRADGVRIDPVADEPGWQRREVSQDAVVWLERTGEAHTNDAMVLERLALALGILRARRSIGVESAVELVVSTYASIDERMGAMPRLRLPSGRNVCVVASPPDPAPESQHPSAVIATRHGLTRATILDADTPALDAWPIEARADLRLGIGAVGSAEQLPASWAGALIAARLTGQDETTIDAADLGALLLVAESAESGPMHPDVAALAALDARTRELLDAVVEEQSVRAAAVRLGRHHSSVQDRMVAVVELLGYDPRSSRGHARYAVARMLLTLRGPEA